MNATTQAGCRQTPLCCWCDDVSTGAVRYAGIDNPACAAHLAEYSVPIVYSNQDFDRINGAKRKTFRLRELSAGTRFRFADSQVLYVSRGNCWFGSKGGYDGGPWHQDGETIVITEPND